MSGLISGDPCSFDRGVDTPPSQGSTVCLTGGARGCCVGGGSAGSPRMFRAPARPCAAFGGGGGLSNPRAASLPSTGTKRRILRTRPGRLCRAPSSTGKRQLPPSMRGDPGWCPIDQAPRPSSLLPQPKPSFSTSTAMPREGRGPGPPASYSARRSGRLPHRPSWA